jgi:hypothetical protein
VNVNLLKTLVRAVRLAGVAFGGLVLGTSTSTPRAGAVAGAVAGAEGLLRSLPTIVWFLGDVARELRRASTPAAKVSTPTGGHASPAPAASSGAMAPTPADPAPVTPHVGP